MSTTTTTTAPALNRRALLSRALAGAAIGATAALPVAKAALVVDPLPALLARRTEIVNYINEKLLSSDEAADLYAELKPIEDHLFGTVATTREGLITQLRFLMGFIEEGFGYDENCDQLVANVITGIERLSAGASA